VRNDLAHANPDDHEPGERLFLMLITQFLLNVGVARGLGINDDTLASFVQHSWGLTIRWMKTIR